MPLRTYFQITCHASRVKLKSMLGLLIYTRWHYNIYFFHNRVDCRHDNCDSWFIIIVYVHILSHIRCVRCVKWSLELIRARYFLTQHIKLLLNILAQYVHLLNEKINCFQQTNLTLLFLPFVQYSGEVKLIAQCSVFFPSNSITKENDFFSSISILCWNCIKIDSIFCRAKSFLNSETWVPISSSILKNAIT